MEGFRSKTFLDSTRNPQKNITVAPGTKYHVVGILTDVPVTFGGLVFILYLLVVEGSTFEVIVGAQSMEEIKDVIDLGNLGVRLTWSSKLSSYPRNLATPARRTQVRVPIERTSRLLQQLLLRH